MGDFGNSGGGDKPVVGVVRKPSLKEAVLKVADSFDSSPLNGKFEMTIDQGHAIFMAVRRVTKALNELERVAQVVPSY